tara:strand:- start:681 stop:932 length:252 start_codon:yes stop_codon:yes gene_type:complete
MTKEEIIKELDELGNVLYNKFGTDSYLERCTIHDLKTKIKALTISDVSNSVICCPQCGNERLESTGGGWYICSDRNCDWGDKL